MRLDHVPRRLAQVGGERVEVGGVGVDERLVEHGARLRRLELEHPFHDPFQRCQVAPDQRLQVQRRDRRGAVGQHRAEILRVEETGQAFLDQRVERDDLGAALARFLQLGQHPRMVGAGVLAEDDDQVGFLEIFQQHRALADTDRLVHRHAAGFVAHVGTIRQVVGAELPDEQLVEERRLVAGAAGGVEDRLVGIRQRAQRVTQQAERIGPADRPVGVRRPVVPHRLGQTTLGFEPVIGFLQQRRHGVAREKFAGHPFAGRLGGHGFHAVLAELGHGGLFRVRPRTTRAIKPARLVDVEQGADRFAEVAGLDEFGRAGGQGRPPAGGARVRGRFFLVHGLDLRTGRLVERRGWKTTKRRTLMERPRPVITWLPWMANVTLPRQWLNRSMPGPALTSG